jgi:hypothetical protein
MKPQAVFVETNWVVDIVAPAHLPEKLGLKPRPSRTAFY